MDEMPVITDALRALIARYGSPAVLRGFAETEMRVSGEMRLTPDAAEMHSQTGWALRAMAEGLAARLQIRSDEAAAAYARQKEEELEEEELEEDEEEELEDEEDSLAWGREP